ncbi:MAG TPA: hypothetical protein VH120_18725 [Gemmataceae bacterium]|nr:hypothetical protein [Gemmataceae bacterium]
MGAVVGGAVLVIAASVWAAVYFVKARPGDPRLIGTWQSDADATIAEMRKAKVVTEQQEKALRKLFGRMKITYSPTTFTTELDGVLETRPYQVLSRDRESVVLKEWSSLTNKEEQYRIRFIDRDTYWVDVEQFKLSECFRRLK